MQQLLFLIELDGTHETLYLVNGEERLMLAAVSLAVLRGNIGAQNEWRALMADAIKAAEIQAVDAAT